jgi:hypothetical protein
MVGLWVYLADWCIHLVPNYLSSSSSPNSHENLIRKYFSYLPKFAHYSGLYDLQFILIRKLGVYLSNKESIRAWLTSFRSFSPNNVRKYTFLHKLHCSDPGRSIYEHDMPKWWYLFHESRYVFSATRLWGKSVYVHKEDTHMRNIYYSFSLQL